MSNKKYLKRYLDSQFSEKLKEFGKKFKR